MTEIIPNEEFITKNYNKIIDLIRTIVQDEHKKAALLALFEQLGERFAVAPASTRDAYYSAFPGGLCYHTLHLVQWVGRFSNLLAPDAFSKESLLVVCLLAEVGKVGDLEEDYYVAATDWKQKNGSPFDINPNLQYMRIPHRSLFLAQHFNIRLTRDEYLAILLSEGQNDEANLTYRYKEPKLADVLFFANTWAQKIEKNNKVKRD